MSNSNQERRKVRSIFKALLPIALMALVGEFTYAVLNVSILPLYLNKIRGFNEETIGIVIVVFLATEALLKSYFGHLGDRIGRKPLMAAGPLLSCISALIMMRLARLDLILVIRILDGIGAAALWPAMFTMAAHKVDEEDRTTAMSILNFTYIAGVAFAFSAGRIIFNRAGIDSFWWVSLLFLLTSLVVVILIRDEPHHHVKTEPMEALCASEPGVGWRDLLHGFLAAPFMGLIIGVAFIGVGMLMGIATLYTQDVLKISAHQMPLVFLPVAGFVAIISVPVGRIVDRWSKALAIKIGLGLCVVAMFALGITTNIVIVTLAASALGVGFVMVSPAWMALITTLTTPERSGAIIGAMGTAQGVGALIGPYFGGLLYRTVNHHAPFLASGVFLTIALIMALFVVHDPSPSTRRQ